MLPPGETPSEEELAAEADQALKDYMADMDNGYEGDYGIGIDSLT